MKKWTDWKAFLGWKSILSLLAVLILQVSAILSGFALKDNAVGLIAVLLCLHVPEILALAYLILNVILLSKEKPHLSFFRYLLVLFLFSLAILGYLEAYLIL